MHPFVLGELAMGTLVWRGETLSGLAKLPGAAKATDPEVLTMVEAHHLYGLRIGYIGAHSLAAARLSAGAKLWTFDERLHATAERLSVAWRDDVPREV